MIYIEFKGKNSEIIHKLTDCLKTKINCNYKNDSIVHTLDDVV